MLDPLRRLGGRVRPAIPEDVSIADLLTDADKAECVAAGHTPRSAISTSIAHSVEAWVAEEPRGPLAVFGVAPGPAPGMGAPWLLCTPLFARHPISMVKLARHLIARWHETFPVLANAADARNEAHLRFLRRLGYQLHPPVPLQGHLFIPFHRQSEHVHV